MQNCLVLNKYDTKYISGPPYTFCTMQFLLLRVGGPIATASFMSDDAPAYWNAWKQAMGEEASGHCAKLLCSWHVKRALFSNAHRLIKNDEMKRFVIFTINDMMRYLLRWVWDINGFKKIYVPEFSE